MNVLRLRSAAVISSLALSFAPSAKPFSQQLRRPAVAVDAVPIVDLSGVTSTGEPLMRWALSAARIGGRIVVVDGLAERLLFFDLKGHLVRTINHSLGAKPGEFNVPSWVGRCAGDSIFVFDDHLSRITVLDTAGNYLRHFRTPPFIQQLRCSTGGTFAAIEIAPRRPYRVWTLEESVAPIQLFDGSGNSTFSVPRVLGSESRPAGRVTSIAMSSDRLFVGTADSAFAVVYDFSARRAGTVGIEAKARVMTRPEFEAIAAIQLSRRPVPDSTMRMVLSAPMPKYHPLYRDLLAAANGTLWLTVSAMSDDFTTVRVFSPEGKAIGDVRIPRRIKLLDVGSDYLIGEYRSTAGFEHVAMYRVRIRD